MDSPALFELPPGPAAAEILKHLSKHDKQQLALSCKHAHALAVSTVSQLTLGHNWYSSKRCQTVFMNCKTVVLKPRTMDELSKLASKLLLSKIKLLPALTELQLQLQGVYDKLCDISLILKSVVLHTSHLTSIYIDQGATVSAKAVGSLVEMPALTTVIIKTAHGFETGAMSKLSNISNTLTSLHLEITEGPTNSPAAQPPTLAPSELARLQASDEVGLAKCTRLTSLTAINLTKGGLATFRPVEALLVAIAGSPQPQLSQLVLANMPELQPGVLELVAGIDTLTEISLCGCSIGGCSDLAKLSVLGGLSSLAVAPQQPSASVLGALAKGCRHLSKLVMGSVNINPAALSMPAVTDLQILAASPYSTGTVKTVSLPGMMGTMSLRLRPPLQLSGFGRVWPGLRRLEIVGLPLDAAGVLALSQLEDLESLRIVGSQDIRLPAKLLLPVLGLPKLQQLHLLELSDLTDEWMCEAVKTVGAAAGSNFAAVRELQLGAVEASPGSPVASDSPSSHADSIGSNIDRPSAWSAPGMAGDPSQLLTDRGLVRLFACPKLHKLTLVQLPGITLAGIKALVRGSQTLQIIHVCDCHAVCAAPADAVARAAAAAPDRAVDLTVS